MRTWMCINYLYSIHVLMKLVCAYARSQIKYEFVACGALGIQGQMDLCTLSKRGKYQWLSRKRRKSTQVVMFLRSPELCDVPDGEGETARQCNAQCFSHTSWLRNLHRRVHPVWMLQMIVREWYYITISPLACIYGRMNTGWNHGFIPVHWKTNNRLDTQGGCAKDQRESHTLRSHFIAWNW